MSGAYAKEFEKWLESTKTENPTNTEFDDRDLINEGDSEDEVDNLSGCASISSLESQGIAGETAPMLTDDYEENYEYNNEIQTKISHHYEEPPILEPVPSIQNQKQLCKSGVLDEGPLPSINSPNKEIAHKQSLPNVCPEEKRVNRNERQNYEQEKEESFCKDGRKISDEYSKPGGNIFDKLNSISDQGDDVPPPLIPSPGALLTDAPSPIGNNDENSSAKLPNNSPDFVAMEADSTSEMFKSNVEDCHTGKKEKSDSMVSQGDVSIECDSTCMLNVSPNVLSPVFSNTDVEDSGNQSDSQVVVHESTSGISEAKGKDNNKSGSFDQECPTLEVADSIKDKKESNQQAPTEEPPVLSVIAPESLHALRRKRHTIDAVENIGSSAKCKHLLSVSPLRPERPADIDSLGPPNLPRQPEAEGLNYSAGSSSKHRKLSTRKHVGSRKKHSFKKGHRCRSYSLVDMNRFIKITSQLSDLQSQMHKLVSLLFPQIKPEMETMSPESVHFENILIALASSLQESVGDCSDDRDIFCSDDRDNFCAKVTKGEIMDLSESISVSQCQPNSSQVHELGADHSLLPGNSSNVASPNHADTNLCFSRHSTGSNGSSNLLKVTNTSEDLSVSESMVPRLSQLTLTSEKEKIIHRQPSVVIKANAHEALRSFSRLVCKVLQLLLPDLTIDLFDVLGDSYHDLLNLIDSVILSNSA